MAEKLLTMLAGCPDGATEYTLAMHGFDRALCDRLVTQGRISAEMQNFTHGQKVIRYRKV